MIRVRNTRLPRFCSTRAMARVQVRSPAHPQFKRSYSSIKKADDKINQLSSTNGDIINNYLSPDMLKPEESPCGNRVMVFVDSTFEAKGALQWALSHSVQTQDTIILLHVTTKSPISKQGVNSNRQLNNQRAYKMLSSMKNTCQLKRPGVKVEMVVQQGKEQGPTIVEEAKEQRVSLLVLGQKKITIMRRLRNKLGRKSTRDDDAVEYCIENASCMAIAVRRKSRKHGGGYLITTKSHKDFWLLA